MSPAAFYPSRGLAGDRPSSLKILAALYLAALLAFPASAQPDPATSDHSTDRAELAAEINGLMRQDRRTEALPLCREYADRFPDDPVMLYNLACLENMAGRSEAAVAAFAGAVTAGFDDFSRAFSDPDLAGLQYHPEMIDLSLEHQVRLTRLAATKAVTLAWESESFGGAFAEGYTEPDPGGPDLNLTWTLLGLELELRAPKSWSSLVDPANPAPWRGGPGLVFTLGIPDSDDEDDFLTANHFLFAFGLEKGGPVGAVFLPGQDRWQVIAELQPKTTLSDEGHLELTATIPWAGIQPYNPLIDDRLGFNAALRLTDRGGQRLASLLPDPAAFRPRSAERRVIPLTFEVGSVGRNVFIGKVSNTISGPEPVDIELIAVSQAAGTGRLAIDFLGGPDQSLLPNGQVSGALELVPGLNRLSRQADFTGLRTGLYLVKAELTFPSGRSLEWGSSVLQLADGWRGDFLSRIELLEPQEKPTALYHLESIDRAVENHPPRRGPGAIATTLTKLDRLLDNAEKDGSILPERGSLLAVYPGPQGAERVCHLYLPSGWKIASRVNPVVVLAEVSGRAGTIADRIGQNYEQGRQMPTLKTGSDEGFPVYLVPRLAPPDNRTPDEAPIDLEAEAAACLEWAGDTFPSAAVSVAAADRSAGAALRLAGDRPEAVKAMIIFAGGNLNPWPGAEADSIRERLADFPGTVPVDWVDFIRETDNDGQGPLILGVLQEKKERIVEVEEVRGGLNFTQIADRTVLWAEGLR